MRLLYLHQHFSTPAGATATRSHAMARALAERGHDVTIACGRYAGAASGLDGPFRHGRRDGRVDGVRVVEWDIPCGNAMGLAARGRAFLRYAARAGGLALAEPWDLILASSTPLTVALPALAAQRIAAIPFVFEIRDPWPELPRAMGIGGPPLWAAMGLLADAACRRAASVIALSDGMAETARARGAAAVHVLPNGCDLDLFGPQASCWRPSGLPDGYMLATYAGAHGRANGLGQVLEAAAILQAGGAPVALALVGEGAEKPALVARAAAMGLRNLRFLEPLPKPLVAGLLAGSGIGLHCLAPVPEFAELTAPNKLMDCLAAGLPVVTNVGGAAARLLAGEEEGPCGIAVPPGDPAALAAALAALAADPARRIAMGVAARALAERRWDRRLLAERFCAVLEAAVAPRAVTEGDAAQGETGREADRGRGKAAAGLPPGPAPA